MNIFKIGLLLTVLLFNLSCSTVSKKTGCYSSENEKSHEEMLDLDENVTEASFIEKESPPQKDLDGLVAYLSHHGIYDQETLGDLDQLPMETEFSYEQLQTLENELEKLDAPELQKEFLYSYIERIRNIGNE